jgi:Bacteriodetes cell division protein (FtsL-like)
MSWIKKTFSNIKENETFRDFRSAKMSEIFRDILNGNILTNEFLQKQYGLIIMLAVLMFMYVGNRYSCEAQLAKQIELKKDIQDIKYESLTISADLMELSRRSKVLKMINERGINLVEMKTPPVIINDTIIE